MTDHRDTLLRSHLPLVEVPLHGAIPFLHAPGRRLLLAQDGLWLEAYAPWCHVVHRLSDEPSQIRLPYGAVEKRMLFCIDWWLDLPSILGMFAERARSRLPDEYSELWAWHEKSEAIERMPNHQTAASPAKLHYRRPELPPPWHLLYDIHSHGTSHAHWSFTDNIDDAGDTKIAVVVGHVDTEQPSCMVRLCIGGLLIPLIQEALCIVRRHCASAAFWSR